MGVRIEELEADLDAANRYIEAGDKVIHSLSTRLASANRRIAELEAQMERAYRWNLETRTNDNEGD